MDFFFVEYRDPLTGLIFLTILIFIVAVANYAWEFFSKKDKKQKLEQFIKKFEKDTIYKGLFVNERLSLSNLYFLAEIFTKSGEFEKAVQIYLIALEKTKKKDEQEFLFLALAQVYFKAGFLERTREVLFNVLKISPRNKQALKILKIVHFKLKNHKENLEILECLFELGEKVDEEKEFIKALQILECNMNDEEKKQKLVRLQLQENSMLKRLLFERYHLFFEQEFSNIIDLLYQETQPLNIHNQEYREFFYALGKIQDKVMNFHNSHCKMFSILCQNGFKASFEFSYSCTECKSTMPLFFYHCPVCYEFNTCKILYEVKNNENY
ncbi:hypothetical protein OQH60_05090 [Campylobacter sp. MIT 21-1685]|uniref:hypothetical protein n=1 Tax=unclassified Campylobacter TaxID=2593542 RepID=UPI00224A7EFA|nr:MULTISPECIES: hypothetical protein [unclassified Campylobacter]MCX2683286.1 hypothetical protein [Campylobacter sp. MIT 21-1684]MCX2751521.1 hypothetical protein [Campylobacter sp. MIT 21-1682]MCX2807720.1 hypothetical protein [Campylobacter sp. MIT 21-1685]